MRKFLVIIALSTLWSAPALAAPVEYVRYCDAFGVGFFYIPGTETCLNAETGETRKVTEAGVVYGESELAEGVHNANEGVALSLALPNATVDPGKSFGAAINVGAFGGEAAVGVAGAFQAGDGLTFNGAVGVGLGRGNVGGRAGVNFSW